MDALLNAFCNDYIYPDDASCCKDLERITKLQFNAFAFLATWYDDSSKVVKDCFN